MTTVTRSVNFAIKRKERKQQPFAETGRIPRISKLMALAIRYDQMLNDGVVKSQTELAELLHVSQPRMTQIMNLLHLSPEIQEEILNLPQVSAGIDPLCERDVRGLVSEHCWRAQLHRWNSRNTS